MAIQRRKKTRPTHNHNYADEKAIATKKRSKTGHRATTPFNGSGIATSAPSIQAQSAWLSDAPLALAQRQAAAVDIGRVQGNRHLQRVIASQRDTKQTQSHGSKLGAVQWKAEGDKEQKVTTRTQAEAVLKQRWSVGKVTEGTQQDQVDEIRIMNSQDLKAESPTPDIAKMLDEADWQAWSPPDGSSVWGWLIGAFEDFAQAFGGVPEVQKIVFYETSYEFVSSARGRPKLEPARSEHASFSGGQLLVYHAAESGARKRGLPTGRTKKSRKETKLRKATTKAGFGLTMVHELGHGLLEAKIRDDIKNDESAKAFMKEYKQHVGWYSGLLYDAGVEEVREAIKKDEVPSYKHRITGRWGAGQWQEQPITEYMTSRPDEDFAETVAVYVTRPKLLEQRSPRRYEFIHSRRDTFKDILQKEQSKE